jgi:hypothetical protein
MKRGQMQFAMIALGLVVAVIALTIAQSVISTATCAGNLTCSNFTGTSYLVVSNIIPIALVGLLVFIAFATLRGK